MKKLLPLICFYLFFNSYLAQATVCAGELNSGNFVTLEVTTWGSMGIFGTGSVKVFDDQGFKLNEYQISQENVRQFGENFNSDSSQKETIGTIVFRAVINEEFHVSIDYRGPNYVDQLEKRTIFGVLRQPGRKVSPNNSMRAWKGDTSRPHENFEFKDIVCAFEQDI